MAKIGRKVRTPITFIKGYNLRDEVLRWQDLPITNTADTEHFLSPEDTREKLMLKTFHLKILRLCYQEMTRMYMMLWRKIN